MATELDTKRFGWQGRSEWVSCVMDLRFERPIGAIRSLLWIVMVFLLAGCGGPEREIIRTLDRLAEELSKEGQESVVSLVGKGQRIGDFLGETCEVELPEWMMTGPQRRQDLVQMALGVRGGFARFQVAFSEVEVELLPSGDALVYAVVRVSGDSEDLSRALNRGEVSMVMRPNQGRWEIVRLEPVEAIRK
ncbi:MAG: hypothetical protein JW706_12115 [Opitutales bacterium]|nr:hypothetical protein [Opitutales bacterium]